MDASKDPGIGIEYVGLVKSHVELKHADSQPVYNLLLTGLGRTVSEDGATLAMAFAFDVMHGIEKPLFNFTCEFQVRYRRSPDANMTWDEFAPAMALAHVVPYLREYVSNTTNRLPVPALVLPPINTHTLIADWERRRQAESRPSSPAPKSRGLRGSLASRNLSAKKQSSSDSSG